MISGVENAPPPIESVVVAVITVPGWMSSVPPAGTVTSPMRLTLPAQVVVPVPRTP